MTEFLTVHNIEFDLRLNDPAWDSWAGDLSSLISSVLDCAARHSTGGQLDILLTGDEEIREINAQWRDKDKPTDVLSFPSDDSPEQSDFLGDIAISYGVMSADAAQMKKPLEAHFSHLLVHGYLHLLGFDHMSDDEAAEMEALEIKILAELGIPDPYSVNETN